MNGEGARIRGNPRVSLAAFQQPVGDLVVTEAGCEVKDGGARAVPVLGVRKNRDALLFQDTDVKQEGQEVKLLINVHNREQKKQHFQSWSSFLRRCSRTNELPLKQVNLGAESSSTKIKSESCYQPAGGVCAAAGN